MIKKNNLLIPIVIFFAVFAYGECPPAPWKKETRPSRISPVTHVQRRRAKALKSGQIQPLETVYKILIIRVQFAADSNPYTTGDGRFLPETNKNTVEQFMEKLRTFYIENSYSQLVASYTVTDSVYSLTQQMDYYGNDTPNDQYYLLVRDIVQHTNVVDMYNLSAEPCPFDHFMIYHAGAGQESESDNILYKTPDDIWSAYVPEGFLYSPINEATFVPEIENFGADPLGVICHEYGHQLGLPDLYYNQVSNIGYWSLMDNGVWLPSAEIGLAIGSNPAHLDAWCKLDLDFITPQEIRDDVSNVTLLPAEMPNAGFKKIIIPVADDPSSEFFLVEYRYRQSGAVYDRYIPGDGILVYHIDNAIAQDTARRELNNINNGYPHRGIDIEEADGIDSGLSPYGYASNAFGNGINLFTDPLSRAYNGVSSGLSMTSDASAGVFATINVVSIALREHMAIGTISNYPNPSYDGRTTFHVRLSRPFRSMDLLVYTMAAEKVCTINSNQFSFSTAKSSDNIWVYEYEWDGCNDDGRETASGAYLYLLRVDDNDTRTGKLAIIK